MTKTPVNPQLESPVETSPRKRKLQYKLLQKTNLTNKQKKKIAVLRSKSWRLQKKNANLSSVIEVLKAESLINQETADALASIDPINKDILKRVAGISSCKKYSPVLRKFALTLHFISPRAYDFVRKSFNTCLPHPQTLTRWYQCVDGEPGFTKESLDALKLLVKNSSKQLYAALCFDEMAIRKHVEWDGENYIGFANTGNNVENDELPIAKEALTFMLTCVNGTWKIPIGYFNINSITAEQKAALVKHCIDLVEGCGINLISVTFDGCAANFSMAKVLGCKLDGDANNFDTSFYHNGKKVVIFPDPSHMIKLVRNALGDKNKLISAEGEIISWDYVKRLVDLQENEGFHLGNKLSKNRINFRKQIMKVKLAVQVFSESVADALEFCRDNLNLNEFSDCGGTVKFIRNINALFDVMNSRNLKAFGYKQPISEKNIDHIQTFLNDLYDYIKNLKYEDSLILYSQRKTGFFGFLLCIKSLFSLYENYVQPKKIQFLCTYKLSQDHIECFFSAIRAKGGYNNNPTARQFKAAYKRMLVHGELKHITTGNCVALNDINILTATRPEIALNATTIGNRCIESETATEGNYSTVIPSDHDYVMDPTILTEFSRQVITYIAGFVVHKMQSEIKCFKCLDALVSPEPYKILQLKKDKGGLHYPSKEVVLICEIAEKIYRTNKPFGKKNSMHYILQQCLKKCLHLNLFSDEHFTERVIYNHYPLLIKCISKHYLNARIHYATKKIVESGEKIRNFYTKLIIFKGQ
ncbi:unnamed protein product [Parnassius mnemosyne]|uniref:DNA transposase THAP9 n=1 Tax=Parnassius mnemosyne TaxID=213953 RepID=A0AAV1KX36_9NEOP